MRIKLTAYIANNPNPVIVKHFRNSDNAYRAERELKARGYQVFLEQN